MLTKTITINEGYDNNIIWGSVDPTNGNIALYSPDNSKTIEDTLTNGASSVHLNIFNGLTIVFNNGRPYQQTTTGYRSVFRHLFQDGQTEFTKTIENNSHYNSWYLTDTKNSHIGFLVDTSGSMTSIYKNVVEQGLEEFIEKQKELEHDVKFYGSTFSNELTHLYNGVDLKTDTTIKQTFYNIIPSGSTAYYDAVMDMISAISKNYTINDEVVLCVVTDGGDNSSKRHTRQAMKNAILEKKNQGWNIIMIGANNFDTEQCSDNYGIGRGSSLDTGTSQESMRHAFRGVQNGIARVRTGENQNIEFSEIERNMSGNR